MATNKNPASKSPVKIVAIVFLIAGTAIQTIVPIIGILSLSQEIDNSEIALQDEEYLMQTINIILKGVIPGGILTILGIILLLIYHYKIKPKEGVG